MEQKPLKVIVMTQNDRFFIPRNIEKASKVCELLAIVEVNCKSSLDNKISDYYKWFGFAQCAKMGVKTAVREAEKYLDRVCGYILRRWTRCAVRSGVTPTAKPRRSRRLSLLGVVALLPTM